MPPQSNNLEIKLRKIAQLWQPRDAAKVKKRSQVQVISTIRTINLPVEWAI